MPQPIAICLEDLAAPPAGRYLRCVALVGRQAGLRLDGEGSVRWLGEEHTACELWVSADDRLILFRLHDGPPVAVHRGGRELEVPAERPVVLLDQDEIWLCARRLRVHVHGVAAAIAAPAPLVEATALSGRRATVAAAAAAAAALALGACGGATTTPQTPPTGRVAPPDAATVPPRSDAGVPIEVRVHPPAPMPTPPPPQPPKK
jgi:hypothetical protein